MEEKESQEVPNYREQLCVYVCLATPHLDTLQSGRNPPLWVTWKKVESHLPLEKQRGQSFLFPSHYLPACGHMTQVKPTNAPTRDDSKMQGQVKSYSKWEHWGRKHNTRSTECSVAETPMFSGDFQPEYSSGLTLAVFLAFLVLEHWFFAIYMDSLSYPTLLFFF